MLKALTMLNQHASNKTLEVLVDNSGTVFAYQKGYSKQCRFLNTVISAIYTAQQSLGVNIVVTKVTRRSD